MPSFDIVSEVDMQEVANAVNQSMKEIGQRFDFKGTKCEIEQNEAVLNVIADDDYKLTATLDVLKGKLVKRGVPLTNLKYGKVESASGGTVRQDITVQTGLEQDQAKAVVKHIKDSKKKVQASIQGDSVRVSGKNRDDLQEIIALLREKDFGVNLQFSNFRD